MIYDLNKEQKAFLRRFGKTGNGLEMQKILQEMKIAIDSASTIPAGSDYGAQVEGRRIAGQLMADILSALREKASNPQFQPDVGIDEYN